MKDLIILSAAAWITMVVPTYAADSDDGGGRLPEGGQSIAIPADRMKFQHTHVSAHGPLKEGDNSPDIQIFDSYGKFGSTQHGTFMKFPVGFDTLPHTHTGDYYAVVIQGVMSNFKPGEKGEPLPVGSYWFQRGGETHITKCLSKTPCVAFLVQNVKFDAQIVDRK